MRLKKPDRFFFILAGSVVFAGFFIFISASLGLLGRDSASFWFVAAKQITILVSGIFIGLVVSTIPYEKWRKFALPLFVASLILTCLVFLPMLGLESGGARRWLSINLGFASLSFQPGEFLKLAVVVYVAAWLSKNKEKVGELYSGPVFVLVTMGVVGMILLAQPNTSTLAIIGFAVLGMFIIAGAKIRHILLLGLLGLVCLGILVTFRPYVKDRIMTYMNPQHDVLGSSYQINQSLIAIGSGRIYGRGFGQSVQKFNFLPEPIGDSIFAVMAEEFGFVGSTTLVTLYLLFALWGLKIATKAKDMFGRLLASGIVILITSQSFINIGAMLGILPLTGTPLVFVSQGGSALFIALIEVGIILNISRNA